MGVEEGLERSYEFKGSKGLLFGELWRVNPPVWILAAALII